MHNNFPICGALKKENCKLQRLKERTRVDEPGMERKKVFYIQFTHSKYDNF